MAEVSVIIPVFNTKQYLFRSIGSVLNQSFTDFELILVDDGSTDGSGDICDTYAGKDDRIRVFHKENGGVSSARNLGLTHANGEWVYFVDSDDEVLPDGLRTLVENISNDIDIVMGGFVEVDEDGKSLTVPEKIEKTLSKKQSIISLYMGYGSYFPYCGYLWMRLLRRKVIRDFRLLFDTSVAIKEDTLFLMQYICKSNGVTRQTTKPVYRYYRRSDSAMGRANKGFYPKYVSSFYALVKMKHEVESVSSSYSVPVFIAKQAIYSRCYSIIDTMNANHIQDEPLKKELLSIMFEEMGSVFLFKVRRKIRKLLRFL